MTLRDDLIPVLDDARSVIDDLGLRRRDIAVVTRTITGTGLSATFSDDVLPLDPRPRLRMVSMREASADGMYQTGDMRITKISASYTREQLDPVAAAGSESFWTVDGDACRLVSLEPRSFEWIAVVRSMNRPAVAA